MNRSQVVPLVLLMLLGLILVGGGASFTRGLQSGSAKAAGDYAEGTVTSTVYVTVYTHTTSVSYTTTTTTYSVTLLTVETTSTTTSVTATYVSTSSESITLLTTATAYSTSWFTEAMSSTVTVTERSTVFSPTVIVPTTEVTKASTTIYSPTVTLTSITSTETTSTITSTLIVTTIAHSAVTTVTSTTRVVTTLLEGAYRPCFIASAAYGSELARPVQSLRQFRDGRIQATYAGEKFMSIFNAFYYCFSPTIARSIASSWLARTTVRLLIYPLLSILQTGSATFDAFDSAPEVEAVVVGILCSGLLGIAYVAPIALGVRFLLRGDRRRRPTSEWIQ